ncbi:MAG: hypothetical protein ACTSRQ_06015 [Candidatus Thorarchaeota archaeon]
MDPDTIEAAIPLTEEPEDEIVDSHTGMYQVWMLAISLSILQIGFGIITPIFPFYIAELGMAGIELGVLAASFAITRNHFC